MDAKRRAELFVLTNNDVQTANLFPRIELRLQALIEAAEADAVAAERERFARIAECVKAEWSRDYCGAEPVAQAVLEITERIHATAPRSESVPSSTGS